MDKLGEKIRDTRGTWVLRGPGVGGLRGVGRPALAHVACRTGADPWPCRALGRWTKETESKEGTRPPAQPRLTPRVGPEGHGPIALHQMRPLKAVFVLEAAVRWLGRGARGAGGRSVASHAIAPDESAERQQQGANERPRSGPGTLPSGPRHLGFWDAEAGGRGRGAGAADGQQGAR